MGMTFWIIVAVSTYVLGFFLVPFVLGWFVSLDDDEDPNSFALTLIAVLWPVSLPFMLLLYIGEEVPTLMFKVGRTYGGKKKK